MELHHSKHHQAYVDNFNKAISTYSEAEKSSDYKEMLAQLQLLRFNGGGHVNHSIFWTNLAPTSHGGGDFSLAKADLSSAITKRFGGLDQLKAEMNKGALGVQGSGWVWLVYNSVSKSLDVVTRANQDPICEAGLTPLLGLDV
jgi:Fe-Mn family superoxide dismutase